jgi:hypothetical protein
VAIAIFEVVVLVGGNGGLEVLEVLEVLKVL